MQQLFDQKAMQAHLEIFDYLSHYLEENTKDQDQDNFNSKFFTNADPHKIF